MNPGVCPNCGAELPRSARACPECGSDEETGWSEQARTDDLGLPNDDFDYDNFVKKEFGSTESNRRLHWIWWLAAALALLAFLSWAL